MQRIGQDRGGMRIMSDIENPLNRAGYDLKPGGDVSLS